MCGNANRTRDISWIARITPGNTHEGQHYFETGGLEVADYSLFCNSSFSCAHERDLAHRGIPPRILRIIKYVLENKSRLRKFMPVAGTTRVLVQGPIETKQCIHQVKQTPFWGACWVFFSRVSPLSEIVPFPLLAELHEVLPSRMQGPAPDTEHSTPVNATSVVQHSAAVRPLAVEHPAPPHCPQPNAQQMSLFWKPGIPPSHSPAINYFGQNNCWG